MQSPLLALLPLLCALLPASAEAQERAVTDVYEPGYEAGWSFEYQKTRIGEHLFRYEGPTTFLGAEAHRFSGWVHLQATAALPTEQRYRGELWTDAAGRALRHVLQAQIGEQYSRIEVSFAAGKAVATVLQGAASQDLEVEVPSDVFLQTNNFIGWFEVLLALHGPAAEKEQSFTLFSSNVLRTLPYSARWKQERTGEEGQAPAVVLSDSLGESITLSAEGRLLELSVQAQDLVVRRMEVPPEKFELTPPRAEPDPRFVYEEVVIKNRKARLAGTITKPRAAEGPLPALFFISGSGLQDRNGFSSGVDVGTHELLDRLTADGFLVLRVDDRGAGASTGDLDDIGFETLVSDARSCVDFLFKRKDVDPERVGLIGHSEGGVTAPLLAVERPEIAAVVLMAATGRPLQEVIMDQNRMGLENAGLEGEALDKALEETRALLNRLAGEGEVSPQELPPDQRHLLQSRRWLRDHASQDPAATIAKLRCPVLILQGKKDFQVSAERDAAALEAALAAAHHPDYIKYVFGRLDHLFKQVQGDESTMAEYFTKRPVHPDFLDVVSSWLRERLLESKR